MARCKRFSFTDKLIEVVPGGLSMCSVVGDTMSVGVVRFIEAGARDLPQKAHAHGEEACLQIAGGCTVFQGVEGEAPKHVVELASGSVMFVPPDEMHYGANKYDAQGVSLRLNVVSPPRPDYGSKDAAKVVYHPLQGAPQ